MPDQAKPLVSALLVSRNSKDLLLQSLQAFFASADLPVEAVVVDNDSSDGSAAAVTDEFPQATVLVQPKTWAMAGPQTWASSAARGALCFY